MRKAWVLDTETKGTGAQMVPLEKTRKQPEREAKRKRRPRKASPPGRPAAPERKPRVVRTTRPPLPSGHVRKLSTGEIGRVRSVDARAGTASVHWLRRGDTSTVRLTEITRR
jgi:hypothetical protein